MLHTETSDHPVEEETEGIVEQNDAHGHVADVHGMLATIEQAQHNKHHRQMHRTLRWPVHSNTPRITF